MSTKQLLFGGYWGLILRNVRCGLTALAGAILLLAAFEHAAAELADGRTLRSWIEAMKVFERGPFKHIRWFCKDGTVLPPQPYGCVNHGGGSQHGEWTDRVKQLRAAGYAVANIFADLDVGAFVLDRRHPDLVNQMIIEQFLISADDGWIFRKARFYRGALQEEGERKGARRLLLTLARDRSWLTRRYLPFRTAVGLLNHGEETRSVSEIRQLSGSLADRDAGFVLLRNKIHIRPDLSDAAAVRNYLSRHKDSALITDYQRLAALIESVHAGPSAAQLLQRLAQKADVGGRLAGVLRRGATALSARESPEQRLATTAELLSALRSETPALSDAGMILAVTGASHALEIDHFVAAAALRDELAGATLTRRLAWLRMGITAGYGTGLFSARQRDALFAALNELGGKTSVDLGSYKRILDYLALAPAWSGAWQRAHFQESVSKLMTIEPRAGLFLQDQLRASPLFFYSYVIDGLLRDANRLAGVSHELFGEPIGAGMRGLNPGLARGWLRASPPDPGSSYDADGIYVLPETVSDLPPVAGILTAGEGNPLSHVQLLARNLGIPNVVIDDALVPRLRQWDGHEVVLAVSSQGVVRLSRASAVPDTVFANGEADSEVLIRPDVNKLELGRKDLIMLSSLRADDSGRSVGPKAARLGELSYRYPDAVTDGLVIPFGVFNELLSRLYRDSAESVFQWMVGQYRAIEKLPRGSEARDRAAENFRQGLHHWIAHADPGAGFRARLRTAMKQAFGSDGSYGVFVRSDTNVEDLPGFTGAGLNLTVANVIGFDNVVQAISRVWASPFTRRAFAWRQSRMAQPEHVYPAVLLLRSVPVDKSGVLVTQDLDSGDPNWFSVAANEGVGGAVDGQAAESLRVHIDSGAVRLMAQATAATRKAISPGGGMDEVPVSGADHVLTAADIAQLIELVNALPRRFPALVDANGKSAPADVEFGFVGRRLVLFQIRPFLESRQVYTNHYLRSLDAALRRLDQVVVHLHRVPRE